MQTPRWPLTDVWVPQNFSLQITIVKKQICNILGSTMNFNFGKVFRPKESGASYETVKVEEALEATTLNSDENTTGKRLLLIIDRKN